MCDVLDGRGRRTDHPRKHARYPQPADGLCIKRQSSPGGVVGNVPSSHRGRVEDASDELEVKLALLDRAVGLGGCNAELAE
eukprot:751772-Pleurochrysis_carterae.AAC.1